VPAVALPEGEKQIGVTFTLNIPDGSQRKTSFHEAQKMFATFPVEDTCAPPFWIACLLQD
jgi:hypothetical protein